MPLTYQPIADFVKDVINDATGIGVIFTEPKDFDTEQDLIDNCMTGDPPHLNVWFITRPSFKNTLVLGDGRRVPIGGVGARIHTFRVDGWYGYIKDKEDPSSYVAFQTVIENVLNAAQGKKSKANLSDSGLVLNTYEIGVDHTVGDTLLEGYICHHATIEFTIEEIYAVTYM